MGGGRTRMSGHFRPPKLPNRYLAGSGRAVNPDNPDRSGKANDRHIEACRYAPSPPLPAGSSGRTGRRILVDSAVASRAARAAVCWSSAQTAAPQPPMTARSSSPTHKRTNSARQGLTAGQRPRASRRSGPRLWTKSRRAPGAPLAGPQIADRLEADAHAPRLPRCPSCR